MLRIRFRLPDWHRKAGYLVTPHTIILEDLSTASDTAADAHTEVLARIVGSLIEKLYDRDVLSADEVKGILDTCFDVVEE